MDKTIALSQMLKSRTAPRGVLRGVIMLAAALFLLPAIAGCAGPLKVNYEARPFDPDKKMKDPVTLLVRPFTDARGANKAFKDPRSIGAITVNVMDMKDAVLTVSDDVASIATDAAVKELKAAGFDVRTALAGKDGDADFIMTGEVNDFRLDIKSRDEINLELAVKIAERETGKVVWSGAQAERGSRYAGVMGNSRESISRYIAASLGKVIRKVIVDATPMILNTRTVYYGVAAPENGRKGTEPKEALKAESGRLIVRTIPNGAKVYLNDVYYGMTPLSADMEPGVYGLTVKLKGHKDASEKVSVRKGQMTDYEATLEKE